jgi:hypothetical protein
MRKCIQAMYTFEMIRGRRSHCARRWRSAGNSWSIGKNKPWIHDQGDIAVPSLMSAEDTPIYETYIIA